MGEILRITLKGPRSRPGEIPWTDVTRLMAGTERALARAADARIGRRARIGRHGRPVEVATRLIFRGIREGSLVAEAELPTLEFPDVLDLDDAHLGELAADDVLDLIRDPDTDADARLVDAIAQLGDELGIGSRNTSLTLSLASSRRKRQATLTAKKQERLSSRRFHGPAHEARQDRIVGTLYEADFDARTAHVRTAADDRIEVMFRDDQADTIQTALRSPTEVEGRVTYDARTGAVVSVEVSTLARPRQFDELLATASDFWRRPTVSELAEEQGVRPVDDLDELAAGDLTDEEIQAFLNALEA